MPQKKKAFSKKSHIARSSRVTSKHKFKPWHAIVGLALFIAGGFVAAYSQASSDTAATKALLPLIQYEEGSGAVIVENDGSTTKLVQGPKTIQLTQAGELFCFGENQDQGATRRLTKPEVSQILSDISNSGLAQLPVPAEDTVQVQTKMIRYIDPKTGEVIGINLANIANNNTSYTKAVGTLQAACAKNNQPTKRENAPEIKVKPNTPTTMSLPAIQRSIIGTAQAAGAAPDPRVVWLNRFNDVMKWNIQNARVKNGLPAYTEEWCLIASASDWSVTMATNYNGNPADKESKKIPLIYHSKIETVIPAKCGASIRVGENVGTHVGTSITADESANSMFKSYMESPSHRAAILDPRFNRFGTASALSASGNRVFNTQHFMLR